MKLWFRRVGHGLFPDGDEALSEFEKLPIDKPLEADLKQAKNPRFRRLYWVLCTRIGIGIGQSRKWVSDAFKVEAELYTIFKYGGRTHIVLGSTSDMDEPAFKEYFERCVQIAYSRWDVDPASVADILAPEESQKHV